jgi:hypothetical protein
MGERVQSLSQVVLQTACTVANAVRAQALFLCSDSPKHVALVEPLLEKTTIVLVTRNPENWKKTIRTCSTSSDAEHRSQPYGAD